MPVDISKRRAFQDKVLNDKRYETKIYNGLTLGDAPLRIPFKSPVLTRATGGGVIIGHFQRWAGEEGSGKSLTNLGIIANAMDYPEIMSDVLEREINFWQARGNKFKALQLKARLKEILRMFPDGMSVCVYDTEQRFLFSFAEQMGIDIHDPDKLIVMDENIIENIAYQMADAVEAYHVVIVDSLSNAESMMEAGLVPGEYERGSAAQAWKRLRRVRRKLDRHENTIILVDQVRTQLGSTVYRNGKQEAEVSAPKNRFIRHNISMSVAFSKGRALYMRDDGSITDKYEQASNDFKSLGADAKEKVGLEMTAHTDKNSTFRSELNAKMRFMYPVADVRTGELIQPVGFDLSFELLLAAEHYHIVENAGGGRFYPLDEDYSRIPKPGKGRARSKGHLSWHGEPAARAAIEESDELTDRILTRLAMDK